MGGPEREQERESGRSPIRLFVDAAVCADAPVALTAAQAHYLRHVMRRARGDRIRLFNGRDGEWEGTIETLAANRADVVPVARLAAQTPPPALWLLFAPLKAERTRFVVEKATELGVGTIHPVLTRRGQTRRVNTARLRAHAIEAAEQCGRLEVPQVAAPASLADTLAAWPGERRLLVCDPEAAIPVAERWPAAMAHPGRSWWAPKADSRRKSGTCSPHIPQPSPPASAPARCGPRPPWRRPWPAFRPSPATGDETTLHHGQSPVDRVAFLHVYCRFHRRICRGRKGGSGGQPRRRRRRYGIGALTRAALSSPA